jgi:hypothetical protein
MLKELTILISDGLADEDTNPLESAVSNLEYDGYTIILASEKEVVYEQISN